MTGVTDTQRQISDFLTGQIHSIPTLNLQKSAHNISLDTTLPVQEPEAPDVFQDPINRLTDVLTNLQNKPQSMTIQPVTTTP